MLYQLSVISTTNVLVGSLASLHLIPPLLSFAHLWHHHITALGWPINVYVNAILPSPALLAIIPTSSRCRPLLPDLLYQRAFLAILPTCPRVAVLFFPNSSTRGTPLWPRRSEHCTQVFLAFTGSFSTPPPWLPRHRFFSTSKCNPSVGKYGVKERGRDGEGEVGVIPF